MHLVRGMEVMSIGQVHQSPFNPDLVREALAGDPGDEVRDAWPRSSTWEKVSRQWACAGRCHYVRRARQD